MMNRFVARGISTSSRLLGRQVDVHKKQKIECDDELMRQVLDAQINALPNSKKLPPNKNRMVIADHEIKSPVYNGVAKELGYRSKNGYELWD